MGRLGQVWLRTRQGGRARRLFDAREARRISWQGLTRGFLIGPAQNRRCGGDDATCLAFRGLDDQLAAKAEELHGLIHEVEQANLSWTNVMAHVVPRMSNIKHAHTAKVSNGERELARVVVLVCRLRKQVDF